MEGLADSYVSSSLNQIQLITCKALLNLVTAPDSKLDEYGRPYRRAHMELSNFYNNKERVAARS